MTATARINIRTTPHAKAIIEQACELMGVSVSNFLIENAYRQALDLLEKEKNIRLTPDEWQNLQQIIENPPAVNANMQTLFDRGYRVVHQ